MSNVYDLGFFFVVRSWILGDTSLRLQSSFSGAAIPLYDFGKFH